MNTNTGTKTGRSETLLLRVPPKVKERLRIVAEGAGRTMTSEAQYRLERSLDQDEGRGGPQIAAMLDYMGSIAALIQRQSATGEEDELIRYWALEGALTKAIQKWLPRPSSVPDYGMRRVSELQAELSELESAAVAARFAQGASPTPDKSSQTKRRGLFGSSMPFSLEPEPEFPAVPHTRALTPESFARIDEWRQKPKHDRELAGAGLFGNGLLGNGLAAPHPEREISVRVERAEDGLRVTGGAEHALRQEQELGLRKDDVTDEEWEWARAFDELSVRGPEFLEEVEKRKVDAERLANTALARVEVRYDLPHDELLELISTEADRRGIKPA